MFYDIDSVSLNNEMYHKNFNSYFCFIYHIGNTFTTVNSPYNKPLVTMEIISL